MKMLITQSNYIPWKGYFDGIAAADHFVMYDDMQFTKRDWRNRNQIKSPNGTIWLTIPVEVKGRFHQKIKDTKASDSSWPKNHWRTIQQHYSKAPHYKALRMFFEELYLSEQSKWLTEINFKFLSAIMSLLKITTKISRSSDYVLCEGMTERLVDICVKNDASAYLTGPSAKAYLDLGLFEKNRIEVHFLDFSKYLEYCQTYPPFNHAVSILDLLFCAGTESGNLIFHNTEQLKVSHQ